MAYIVGKVIDDKICTVHQHGNQIKIPEYQCRECLYMVNLGITHEGLYKIKPTLWETIYYQTTWYTCSECGHKWEKYNIVQQKDIREVPSKIVEKINEMINLVRRSF